MELQTDAIPNQEQILTVNEARAWLRLGKTRVNELIQRGELPSYKVGRRRFLRRGDIEEWLERCRYQPGEN